MHELSIAMEVCRMAEHTLGADTTRLRRVALTVGDDAGVERDNLAFCLDVLLSQPPFGTATAQLAPCAGDVLRVDSYEVDDDHPND